VHAYSMLRLNNLRNILKAYGLQVENTRRGKHPFLVWLGKLKGFRQMSRVYGPDLMWALCEVASQIAWYQC